jgi:uncharacterized protein (TIGR02594 family)
MRTRWAELAFDELLADIREVPGPEHNPRILQYLATVGHHGEGAADETPWCSAFVNWCLQQALVERTRKANARSFRHWGRSVGNPNIGCIVVLWREHVDSWKGHVGIYVGEFGDQVLVLGGNQGNRVSIAPYPKARVLGYRMPLESDLLAT